MYYKMHVDSTSYMNIMYINKLTMHIAQVGISFTDQIKATARLVESRIVLFLVSLVFWANYDIIGT